MRRRMIRRHGMRRFHRYRMRSMRFRHRFMPFTWSPMFWWPRVFIMGSFLYFLFGSKPYKVHRNDVTVIERETSKNARDLSEEELVSTMRRLGIKRLELTEDERISIDRADR